jgi:magnesium-transporting ATPase (P-type)
MEENQSLLELQVDRDAATNLLEVSRWGKFLGLLVSIGIALFFVMFIIVWGAISKTLIPQEETDPQATRLGMIFAFAFLVIIGGVVVLLMSFLIKGANRIRKGIQNRDQMLFNSGLASLKNYFVMYGVLALIVLFISLLALLIN